MDTREIRTLCLKQVYGASLTEAERAEIDEFAQTDIGRDYMRECQEVKDLLKNVADVKIKPVDHEAMVENFELTVRQKFNETVFQPWRQANSAFIILGILAALLIVVDGGNVIYAVLLGSCVLYVIADWFQRCYFAKILSRPDLYEYAKASRKRSDRILQSLPGMALVAVLAGLLIVAVLYVAYWSHREFGFIGLAIVILVLVETVAIFVYQNRKRKSSDPEVWDWWAEEIKE
ncbi:hypothetical protein [uncultured Rubinisphaera sp.]|uniref:hypothetical protein n=1 Tax=uncultured Rubinisphaera sp. TaxID=1678686 RepID=UPI0030DDB47C